MESPVLLTVSPVPLIVIYKVILVVSMKKIPSQLFLKTKFFFCNNEWARLHNIRVVSRPEIQGTIVAAPGLGSLRAGAHKPHPAPRHAHVDG